MPSGEHPWIVNNQGKRGQVTEEVTDLHPLQARQRRSVLIRLLLHLHAPQRRKLQTLDRTSHEEAWNACRIALTHTLRSVTLEVTGRYLKRSKTALSAAARPPPDNPGFSDALVTKDLLLQRHSARGAASP